MTDVMFDPVDLDALTQADRIERKLDTLTEMVISLKDAHDDMVTKVNSVIAEVQPHLDTIGPMIEQVKNHPMARMLGIK